MIKLKGKKQKAKNKSAAAYLIFASCLFTFAFYVGCGKRRPPLPPVEAVPQRTELLSGAQQGNLVILSWPAPRRNAPDQSVQSIRRIDVYRLAEPVNAPLPLTEDEYARRATLVGSVTYAEIERATETLSYTDALQLTAPVRLRYAVRYVNAAGQRASFSNFLLIEPAARVSQPPTLTAINESEQALIVRWEAPAANIDGSTPPNILGFNVYRTTRGQTEPAQRPLNTLLVTGTEYADQNFQFDRTYTYVVRAVSLGTGGLQVESLNSNTETVTPRDVYPPSAPTGISIGPAPGRLAIFFAANPERDVVGYHIYRSTDPDLPLAQWTGLTPAPLTRTIFTDETVESGTRYYYYLTAVDAAGNVSQPSAVESEIVP